MNVPSETQLCAELHRNGKMWVRAWIRARACVCLRNGLAVVVLIHACQWYANRRWTSESPLSNGLTGESHKLTGPWYIEPDKKVWKAGRSRSKMYEMKSTEFYRNLVILFSLDRWQSWCNGSLSTNPCCQPEWWITSVFSFDKYCNHRYRSPSRTAIYVVY